MKPNDLKVLRSSRPVVPGLFLFAVAAALILWTARTEAFRADASGCPYLTQASSPGCPQMAGTKPSGCPHMDASKASGCPCMAGAEGPGCPYLAGEKDCLHALNHSVKLDEEQAAKVHEIQDRFLKDSADLKTQIREAAAELDRLFRDPEASRDEILSRQQTLADLKDRLDGMAMDSRLEIRSAIAAEQLRQIPEGCWHGILAYGHGHKCKGGCSKGAVCPYSKPAPSDVPS
jgi:hypothetical protein